MATPTNQALASFENRVITMMGNNSISTRDRAFAVTRLIDHICLIGPYEKATLDKVTELFTDAMTAGLLDPLSDNTKDPCQRYGLQAAKSINALIEKINQSPS